MHNQPPEQRISNIFSQCDHDSMEILAIFEALDNARVNSRYIDLLKYVDNTQRQLLKLQ